MSFNIYIFIYFNFHSRCGNKEFWNNINIGSGRPHMKQTTEPSKEAELK